MWILIISASFIFSLWLTGTYDKYPELTLPLFLIYLAVISPALIRSEYERKWRQLEKRRMKAVKANPYTGNPITLEEEVKIEEEREKLELYNIPVTLGHLNTFRGELDKRLTAVENKLYSIDERLKRGSE